VNIGLKIDVNTYRGTRHGVPTMVEILKKRAAGATFLFTLGPDHTGRAIRRLFRAGFLPQAWRTAALSHYGLLTALRGTVLPGPDIGRRCAELMRAVRDTGFEVGMHGFDHVRWEEGVAHADAAWTRRELERACQRFREVFGTEPRVHGAAGWRMNRHAYRLTQALGFGYCSDTRGTQPFVPLYQAEVIACPQVPTTLPTLDELIGTDGITRDNVADRILEYSRDARDSGHVYTARAEVEGMKFAPVFERLLQGWREMGCRVLSLTDYFDALPDKDLPRHELAVGTVPGRSEQVALQGEEFLA
jgi:peptidoglycan/xylan/chitin deacetylase (PgdA/CDA1 family)